MDRFLTTKDIAKILQIMPRTVINMIKRGELRAVKIGKGPRAEYRIYEKEIDRFMAESYQKFLDEREVYE